MSTLASARFVQLPWPEWFTIVDTHAPTLLRGWYTATREEREAAVIWRIENPPSRGWERMEHYEYVRRVVDDFNAGRRKIPSACIRERMP